MKLLDANPAPTVQSFEELPGKSNYFIGNDPKKWRTNIPSYAKVKHKDVYPGVDMIYYGNHQQLEYDFVVAPGANPRDIKLAFSGMQIMRIDAQGDLVLRTAGGELRQHKPIVYQETGGTKEYVAGRFLLKGRHEVRFEIGEYDASRPLVIDPVFVYSTYFGSGQIAGNGIAADAVGNAYVTGYTSTNFPTANPLQPNNAGDLDAFVAKLNPTGTALVYSTYIGGSLEDRSGSIAVDAAGNAYITGYSYSQDFPTMNPAQASNRGHSDTFLTKINPTGTALVYSTYVGGIDDDRSTRIAVDATGNAHVTGDTFSTNFPTVNALQPSKPSRSGFSDIFVTKLNPGGTEFIYSTYFGGTHGGTSNGIAVDPQGSAYLIGQTSSTDFPLLNAYQPVIRGGHTDAFVTKLNSVGTALVYSTFLGGNGDDFGHDITVDAAGNAYLTGQTSSTDFPRANPLQPFRAHADNANGSDAFVTKLNAAGTALIYSTYLGGRGITDSGSSITVDNAGNAYVCGHTTSFDFPTANALQANKRRGPFEPSSDAFLTKLDSSGTALVYSTYLGGGRDDGAGSIAVDSVGNAYMIGGTSSTDFPTANPLQPTGSLTNLAFVTKIFDSTTFSVEAIAANKGGNTGEVSVAILGNVFRPGVTVKLTATNQPDIAGKSLAVINSSRITTTFDLRGAVPGPRDVTVTAPDGLTSTLHNGFTVEQGGQPELWGQIVGRHQIRPGQDQIYEIVIGNRGNVDANAPLLTLSGSDNSVFHFNQYGAQDPALRIYGAGSEGNPAKLAPGSTTTLTATIKTPSPLNSQVVYHLNVFDREASDFPWGRLANEGMPPGTSQADWSSRVTKARQRIGESWGAVLGAIRQVSNVPGGVAGNYNNFDEVLVYIVDLYGTELSDFYPQGSSSSAKPKPGTAASLDTGNVRVIPRQAQRNPNGKDYVITHGYNGIRDDFNELADKIKSVDPTANIYIVDWSPIATRNCGVPCPQIVAPSINEVGDEAFRQLQALGAQANKITGIGESFGNYVNARIAQNYGAIDKIIALNPAFEGGGYVPPNLRSLAAISVAFQTLSIFDTNRSIADFNVLLMTPPGTFNPLTQHEYGIRWLIERLNAHETEWLNLTVPFHSCGSSLCFDGSVSGSAYSSAVIANKRFLSYYAFLGALLAGQTIHDQTVNVVGSFDPNDKVGPAGAGANKYIAAQQPVPYAIFFENLPGATAPAQKVVITDTLSPAVFDLQTLVIGPISFGDKQVIPVPASNSLAGVRAFNAAVDLRPGNNLIVNVNAQLNVASGAIKWTFYSIDPTTGFPPTDPLAGFLPPGGEGNVTFTLSLRANLSTNTSINNSASIVFDENDAIFTPVWSNRIDNAAPVSHVTPLPATQNSASFNVQWSGTDSGSGISDYTIYVSDNGGPFTPWLTHTSSTQATFMSTANHTYSFFSVATDLTGNAELIKSGAEATTRIVPIANIVGRVSQSTGNAIDQVTLTLSGSRFETTQTSSNGEYLFANLPKGNYTVTPSRTNHTFNPTNRTFNDLTENQTANFTATITGNGPILISEETSTRALAIDSVVWLRDPFQLNSPVPWGFDTRTRVMLFAMNLDLQAGEDISIITADAEDASHRIFPLTVEFVDKVPGFDWLSCVVIRLHDEMGDIGDVLVRIRLRGVPSNRVRLGIGHNGGGPPDDVGAVPTPGREP